MITLNSPSVEESGIPLMEFQDPVIGVHRESETVLSIDNPVSEINRLEIAFKDLDYVYEGKKNASFIEDSRFIAYMYDITDGSEKLVKEVPVHTQARENYIQYYTVISALCNKCSGGNQFLRGTQYRFVIPEGMFTVGKKTLWGYVRNPEMSYEFYGAILEKVELLSTSVQDGAELSELYNIIYKSKGEFELNPEAKAYFKGVNNSYKLLTSSAMSGETTVVTHIYNGISGGPQPLHKGYEYSVTLPAGTLYYPGDENIKSEEIVINITPVERKPEVVDPEFVTVSVAVANDPEIGGNGVDSLVSVHTYSMDAVKGKKFNIQLAHDNWEVTALYRDGNDVLPMMSDGSYTTPTLKDNTSIEANLAYKGELVTVDQTAGVAEPTVTLECSTTMSVS